MDKGEVRVKGDKISRHTSVGMAAHVANRDKDTCGRQAVVHSSGSTYWRKGRKTHKKEMGNFHVF